MFFYFEQDLKDEPTLSQIRKQWILQDSRVGRGIAPAVLRYEVYITLKMNKTKLFACGESVRRGRRTLRIIRDFVRFLFINPPSFASQNPPPFQRRPTKQQPIAWAPLAKELPVGLRIDNIIK